METENQKPVTTLSTGLRYGLVLGLISIAFFIVLIVSGIDTTQGWGRWSSLILSGAILFFAQQYFKENGDGWMTYGQGIGVGFYTGLISSIMMAVFLFIFMQYIDTDFSQMLADQQRMTMEEQGMSDEQIDQAMKMVAKFTSPGWMFVFGIAGGTIGMVIVALIMTIFTQAKNPNMPE